MTAKLAIQGEMGWSSFESRDAGHKLKYLGRLHHMEDERIAKQIHKYIRHKGLRTEWIKNIARIDSKYSQGTRRHLTNNEKGWNKEVSKDIKTKAEEMWKKGTEKKKSLKIYSKKSKPSWEESYNGTRESALWFQARTGCLPTSTRKIQVFGEGDPTCRLCQQEEEDLGHLFLRCNKLKKWNEYFQNKQETLTEERRLQSFLNLNGQKEDESYEKETKRLLINWEKEKTKLERNV